MSLDRKLIGFGGKAGNLETSIRIRHIVFDVPGQNSRRLFHEPDRDPLARAAVIHVVISAPLRNEVEGAAVPIAKPLWPKRLRCIPRTGVVVRPVKAQNNAPPARKLVSSPLEVAAHQRRDCGKEGVEAPDLLDEEF